MIGAILSAFAGATGAALSGVGKAVQAGAPNGGVFGLLGQTISGVGDDMRALATTDFDIAGVSIGHGIRDFGSSLGGLFQSAEVEAPAATAMKVGRSAGIYNAMATPATQDMFHASVQDLGHYAVQAELPNLHAGLAVGNGLMNA